MDWEREGVDSVEGGGGVSLVPNVVGRDVTPSNSNICSKQSANAKRNEGEGETETLFGMSHPMHVAFSPKFIYCIFLHKFAQMIWKLM